MLERVHGFVAHVGRRIAEEFLEWRDRGLVANLPEHLGRFRAQRRGRVSLRAGTTCDAFSEPEKLPSMSSTCSRTSGDGSSRSFVTAGIARRILDVAQRFHDRGGAYFGDAVAERFDECRHRAPALESSERRSRSAPNAGVRVLEPIDQRGDDRRVLLLRRRRRLAVVRRMASQRIRHTTDDLVGIFGSRGSRRHICVLRHDDERVQHAVGRVVATQHDARPREAALGEDRCRGAWSIGGDDDEVVRVVFDADVRDVGAEASGE